MEKQLIYNSVKRSLSRVIFLLIKPTVGRQLLSINQSAIEIL